MTSKNLLSAACIAAIASIRLDAAEVSAQAPTIPAAPPSAPSSLRSPIDATGTISIGLDQSVAAVSRNGSFERVGLKHGQVVEIAVQYPVVQAGRSIVAEPLDGRQVISHEALVVGADGMMRFQFQAGHEVGIYQVALHDGAQELGLQFWVLDELHPEKNPLVINSKN